MTLSENAAFASSPFAPVTMIAYCPASVGPHSITSRVSLGPLDVGRSFIGTSDSCLPSFIQATSLGDSEISAVKEAVPLRFTVRDLRGSGKHVFN